MVCFEIFFFIIYTFHQYRILIVELKSYIIYLLISVSITFESKYFQSFFMIRISYFKHILIIFNHCTRFRKIEDE